MHFPSAVIAFVALMGATVNAAPVAAAEPAPIEERNNPKFDWPGRMDEALEKREPNNPKFDWPGRMDEALEKRNNPKFDWPGRMDEALEKREPNNPKFDWAWPYGRGPREA